MKFISIIEGRDFGWCLRLFSKIPIKCSRIKKFKILISFLINAPQDIHAKCVETQKRNDKGNIANIYDDDDIFSTVAHEKKETQARRRKKKNFS